MKQWFAWIMLVAVGVVAALGARAYLDARKRERLCREHCFPFVAVDCHLPTKGDEWKVSCATASGKPLRTNPYQGYGMLEWNQKRELTECQQRCPCGLLPIPAPAAARPRPSASASASAVPVYIER